MSFLSPDSTEAESAMRAEAAQRLAEESEDARRLKYSNNGSLKTRSGRNISDAGCGTSSSTPVMKGRKRPTLVAKALEREAQMVRRSERINPLLASEFNVQVAPSSSGHGSFALPMAPPLARTTEILEVETGGACQEAESPQAAESEAEPLGEKETVSDCPPAAQEEVTGGDERSLDDLFDEDEDEVATPTELKLSERMPDEEFTGTLIGKQWGAGECWNLVDKFGQKRYHPTTPLNRDCWPVRRYANVENCHPSFHKEGSSSTIYYRIDTICQGVLAKWPKSLPSSQYKQLYVIRWAGWEDTYNSLEPRENITDEAFEIFERRERGILTGSTGVVGSGSGVSGDVEGVSLGSRPSTEGVIEMVEKIIDGIEDLTGVTGVRLCGVGR